MWSQIVTETRQLLCIYSWLWLIVRTQNWERMEIGKSIDKYCNAFTFPEIWGVNRFEGRCLRDKEDHLKASACEDHEGMNDWGSSKQWSIIITLATTEMYLLLLASFLVSTPSALASTSSLVAVAGCDGRSDKKELQVTNILYYFEGTEPVIAGYDHSSAPRS